MIPLSGRVIRHCKRLPRMHLKPGSTQNNTTTNTTIAATSTTNNTNELDDNSTLLSLSQLSIEDLNTTTTTTTTTTKKRPGGYTQEDYLLEQQERYEQYQQMYPDNSWRQASYIEHYPQYPQHLQHIQQPLPYLQNYPTQYQYNHYYSTYANNAAQQNNNITIRPSSAIPIKKPPGYIDPNTESVEKEKASTPPSATNTPKSTTTRIINAKTTTTTTTKTTAKKANTPTTNATKNEAKQQLKLERQKFADLRRENNARFKELLESLPILDYPSHYTVECVTDADDANVKLLRLLQENKDNKYGLDLEWPPCFVKGKSENKVSLVQICSRNRILLLQLSRMQGIPTELRRFFESKELLKSGVNIGADGLKLKRDFGIVTNGLVELRDLAESGKSPKLNISHLRSLRALTGLFLEQNMAKGSVRVSNWARHELTPLQVKYAALDAYASYQLFVVLEKIVGPKAEIGVRHLIDDESDASKRSSRKGYRKKNYNTQMKLEVSADTQELQLSQQKPESSKATTSSSQLNNRSSPTSTVTIIKRKPSN